MMNRMRRNGLLISMLVLFFIVKPQITLSQLSTSEGDRPLLMGARGMSLSDANSANETDASALYWNPGSLAFLERATLVIDEYYEWKTAINNDMVAIAIPQINISKTITGTLGIGTSLSHAGYIKEIDPYNYQALAYGIDIGYATIFSQGLSAGVRFHGQYGHTGKSDLVTNDWALGFVYTPSTEISYGLVWGGLGDGILVTDSTTLERQSLPCRLELAMTLHYPSVRNRQFLTLSLSNEKIFGRAGLYYKVGVEILPYRFIALRFGFDDGPETQTPRYGAGLRMDSFRLDYAISPSTKVLRFQQITLSLNL